MPESSTHLCAEPHRRGNLKWIALGLGSLVGALLAFEGVLIAWLTLGFAVAAMGWYRYFSQPRFLPILSGRFHCRRSRDSHVRRRRCLR